MASMKQESNYSSSNYGEDAAARQANVLASCYLVDSSASLRGLHYCTTSVTGLPSPPTSPPLAAITSDNELALTHKSSKRQRSATTTNAGPGGAGRNNNARQRRGATSRIREECERFFCETMRAVFRDERNSATRGSGLTGVYDNHHHYHHQQHYDSHYSDNGQLSTPPPNDYPFPDQDRLVGGHCAGDANVVAWMEIWDYVGGAGFRGFLVEDGNGEKSAFVFFDMAVVGRDLKQALIAIMELADGPLDCSKVVIAIDREIPVSESKSLMRGLQWAGFSLASLDNYAGGALDITSPMWLFMAHED
ncbi:hypothetical protein RB597_005121 [Gaeumannomyces tritici]